MTAVGYTNLLFMTKGMAAPSGAGPGQCLKRAYPEAYNQVGICEPKLMPTLVVNTRKTLQILFC